MFLDTETTGLGLDAEIVDIAIVGLDGGVLLDTLVRPLRPIPIEASLVHGITDEMVADAMPWSEVYWIVRMVLMHKRVVIYNARYDFDVLAGVSRASDLRILEFERSCAMHAYADFAGVPGKRPGTFKWHKLGDACGQMGIGLDGAHRALADTIACRELVMAMAAAALPSAQIDHQAALTQPT